MKFVLVLMMSLLPLSSAFAAKMCPTGSSELYCTNKGLISWYPFVSVCETAQGAVSLMLDVGATRRPEAIEAAKTESVTEVTITATEEGSDQLKLVVAKSSAARKEAVLSFDMGWYADSAKYLCE